MKSDNWFTDVPRAPCGRRTKGEAGDEILPIFKYLATLTKNSPSGEFFVGKLSIGLRFRFWLLFLKKLTEGFLVRLLFSLL